MASPFETAYAEPLMGEGPKASREARKWKALAAAGGLLAAGALAGVGVLANERAALAAQVAAHEARSNFVIRPAAATALAKAETACTAAGKDVYENPQGEKLPCCKGLVNTPGKCRGDDVCMFCVPDVRTEGPRTEYPPAKVSIDPATPKAAVDKYKKEGMSLIWSDEFKARRRAAAPPGPPAALARRPAARARSPRAERARARRPRRTSRAPRPCSSSRTSRTACRATRGT
jgi:hypothetical protein